MQAGRPRAELVCWSTGARGSVLARLRTAPAIWRCGVQGAARTSTDALTIARLNQGCAAAASCESFSTSGTSFLRCFFSMARRARRPACSRALCTSALPDQVRPALARAPTRGRVFTLLSVENRHSQRRFAHTKSTKKTFFASSHPPHKRSRSASHSLSPIQSLYYRPVSKGHVRSCSPSAASLSLPAALGPPLALGSG